MIAFANAKAAYKARPERAALALWMNCQPRRLTNSAIVFWKGAQMICSIITSIATSDSISEPSLRLTFPDAEVSVGVERGGHLVALFSSRGRGTHQKKLSLPPQTSFPTTYDPLRPVLSARRLGSKYLVISTVDEQSGVYGYKRLIFWELSPKSINQIKGGPFGFSDFGSWCWDAGATRLHLWDMVYDDQKEPHEGAHRYLLLTLAPSINGVKVVSRRTTRMKYSPGWDINGSRPRRIEMQNDPLREFNLSWKWWGQEAPRPSFVKFGVPFSPGRVRTGRRSPGGTRFRRLKVCGASGQGRTAWDMVQMIRPSFIVEASSVANELSSPTTEPR